VVVAVAKAVVVAVVVAVAKAVAKAVVVAVVKAVAEAAVAASAWSRPSPRSYRPTAAVPCCTTGGYYEEV
jgi:hypothetical protein